MWRSQERSLCFGVQPNFLFGHQSKNFPSRCVQRLPSFRRMEWVCWSGWFTGRFILFFVSLCLFHPSLSQYPSCMPYYLETTEGATSPRGTYGGGVASAPFLLYLHQWNWFRVYVKKNYFVFISYLLLYEHYPFHFYDQFVFNMSNTVFILLCLILHNPTPNPRGACFFDIFPHWFWRYRFMSQWNFARFTDEIKCFWSIFFRVISSSLFYPAEA